MNRDRKATSVRWRYPVRQGFVTVNRLDPANKFDVHAGKIWWNGDQIAWKRSLGEMVLAPEDAGVSFVGIDKSGKLTPIDPVRHSHTMVTESTAGRAVDLD